MGRKAGIERASVAAPERAGARLAPRDPGLAMLTCGVALGGIGVSLAMMPGGYNPFGPAKALTLLVAAVLVLAGAAADPGRARAALARAAGSPVTWAVAAFVLVTVLATLTSLDPWQSLVGHYPGYQGLLLLLVSAIVGAGAFVLSDDEHSWTRLGRVAVVATLVVAAYGFVQFAGVDPVPSLLEFVVRRVRSTLGNASNLGVFLVMALPLVLARVRAETGGWRRASWVAAAAGAVLLVMSLSRGAWVGAIAGGIGWLLVEGRGWDRARLLRTAGAAAAALAVVVVLAVVLIPDAGQRLEQAADTSAGTPAWRVEVWTISAGMVAARPVLGYGPGSYRYAVTAFRTAATMAGEGGAQVLDDPHNVLASVAVSSGVTGLIAFLALVVSAVAAAWRRDASRDRVFASPVLVSALVGGFVALQFHFFTLDTAPMFAMLCGLAAGGVAPAGKVASAAGPRADAIVRWAAVALAVLAAAGATLAAGLVASDLAMARGFGLVRQKAPWTQARPEFETAAALAPWEPAAEWAVGRAATQWMSLTRDASAFPDAEAAMLSTLARLSRDPLAVAQTAEAYLVGGLAAGDTTRLEKALVYSQQAIALDPENGYRWETKGTALAALGHTDAAIGALEKAVGYAPQDAQAWSTLAGLYGRLGDAARAADAQRRADALAPAGPGAP